jgi:hypothetical protein
VLQEEFDRRRRRNPRYSLRSFALALGFDSGSLAQVLTRRRRASPRLAEALSARIGIAPPDREAIAAESRQRSHGCRILRQIVRDDFLPDSRRLARRLRLRTDQINAAIARLLREGRLRMASTTRWYVAREHE